MFLSWLDSALTERHDDPAAVTINGSVLSRTALRGAATANAGRLGGARSVAVWAEPTAEAVVAILACVFAGVRAVIVNPAAAVADSAELLRASGAQGFYGAPPSAPLVAAIADTLGTLPVVPVRTHARDWHRLPTPPAAAAMLHYAGGQFDRREVEAIVAGTAAAVGLSAADTLLCPSWPGEGDSPVAGVVLGLFSALSTGARLRIGDGEAGGGDDGAAPRTGTVEVAGGALRRRAANARRILAAIDRLEAGGGVSHQLIE